MTRVMLYLLACPIAGVSITRLHLPWSESLIVALAASITITVVAHLLPAK